LEPDLQLGQLALIGEATVTPSKTTVYHLTASGPNTLTAVAIILVEVKRQIPKGASTTGFAGYLRDGLDEKTTGSGIKYDKNA
jgi:rare lipoprotein A (peptidoglycan hydrolase)